MLLMLKNVGLLLLACFLLLFLAPMVGAASQDLATAIVGTAKEPAASPTKLNYRQGREKALAEKRDLVVWVGGFVCPSCLKENSDAVHCFTDSISEDSSPRVLVGCYNPADNTLWCMNYLHSVQSGPNGSIQKQRAKIRSSFGPTMVALQVSGNCSAGNCANGACSSAGNCGMAGCGANGSCGNGNGAAANQSSQAPVARQQTITIFQRGPSRGGRMSMRSGGSCAGGG